MSSSPSFGIGFIELLLGGACCVVPAVAVIVIAVIANAKRKR